jgi:hypothetical protein
MPQQGGLVLRAGDGDARLGVLVGGTARSRACSTPASSSGSAAMRLTSGASASTGSNCSAPTQSRPISASRLKGLVSASRKRDAMRRRMASWSGSRLSK